MSGIFFALFILSITTLIVGVRNPQKFEKLFKKVPSKKSIVFIFGILSFILLMMVGTFAPQVPVQTIEQPQVSQEVTNNIQSVQESQIVQEEPTQENTTTSQAKAELVEKKIELVKTEPVKATAQQPQYAYYAVSSVVDGDTVKVNISGTITTLRLIGMDTPETVDPRKPVQCFGKEASNKAKELLSGKKVRIETDPTQGELDKYGRRLAYIYREDGLFYNKYMIEQGYAHEYTYNTPYKYQTEFKSAQKYAEENNLGLWSPNTCNEDTTQSMITTQTTSTPTSGKYYTSSYSTSKYWYPESCDGWKSLNEKYLKSFNSLEELLAQYPNRVKSSQCE